jgi:hypothetical protein
MLIVDGARLQFWDDPVRSRPDKLKVSPLFAHLFRQM